MLTRILSLFPVSRRDNCDRYYLFKLWGFALFLHRLHTDEDKDTFHNHPWSGFSFIFGTYWEQYPPYLGVNPRWRSWFNWLPATRHHRIQLPYGPVWTLFFHFRRSNRWTVIDGRGTLLAEEPWRGVDGEVTSYRPPEQSCTQPKSPAPSSETSSPACSGSP